MAIGRKYGGRKKGTPNKATREREAKIAASGLTPLDYMLRVLRDEQEKLSVRLSAASAAAPYVHPKLSNIDMRAKVDGKLEVSIVRYSPPEPVGSETVPATGLDRSRKGM